MANVKTAISLQKSLFEQVNILAQKMNISRSRLFALALEEYIQRYQNQKLLEQINRAYEDGPDPAEGQRMEAMRRRQRHTLEDQW
jgi:metal-responsive CopG/Arc/MetJ family transcriptional regulator